MSVRAKSTKISYVYDSDLDLKLAEKLFGPPGTQVDRRWFYRLYISAQEWRKAGRHARLQQVFYFRNNTDATFFCLKKSQK